MGWLFAFVALAVIGGFLVSRQLARSRTLVSGTRPHSQPGYHGYFAGGLIGVPAFIVVCLIMGFVPGLSPAIALAIVGAIIVASMALSWYLAKPDFAARDHVELWTKILLGTFSAIAVFTTLGIVATLLFESLRFFEDVPIFGFLAGLHWSPQTGSFGAVPVFTGTFLIMAVAMLVAGPIGLMIAIYLSEYASKKVRATVKPIIEVLAGIPTVVYGFFGLLAVGPAVRGLAETMGLSVSTQSALAAGTVMGVMIIPLISSLSDDIINAVPQSMRDGSYALGATRYETTTKVVFASALPGIMGAFVLAISRAIGETMIVVMAAGRSANLTANPFEAVTTVTVQIVAVLTGDQEFDSAKTRSAFALGLVLFFITLALNVIALRVVRKYREKYE